MEENQFVKHKTSLLHTHRGNVIRLVREHYLRKDIDCGFDSKAPFFAPGSTIHIFDSETILNQIDAFDSPLLNDSMILQTVYDLVKTKSRATQNRLDKILRDTARHYKFFDNEHFADTYQDQTSDMTSLEHHRRNIFSALRYLQQFPAHFIYISNTDEDAEAILSSNEFQDYSINPDSVTIQSIHQFAASLPDDSLVQKLAAVQAISDANIQYEPYLSPSDVARGITDGIIFVGQFDRSKEDVAVVHVNVNMRNRSLNLNQNIEESQAPKPFDIVLANKKDQNRAINGYTVAVQIDPSSRHLDGQREVAMGKVVAITAKPPLTICGTVLPPRDGSMDQKYAIVVPNDPDMPKVRIQTRQISEILGYRVQVAIDGWDLKSRYPHGHYVATIGRAGSVQAESEVIMLTCQIPHDEFSAEVNECLPPEDYVGTPEEIARRRDLRDRNVCSIDPPGCTDIDDALHYRDLDEATAEVGVHIADVSFFVREGTAIDLEARERGTSVYLTEKRINMLPGRLSENLCSLMGGVDRFAFSVVAVLDKRTAETRDIWFGRSIVHSRAALSYPEAQAMHDDPGDHSELAESVRGLMALSRILKQKRSDAGALKLASPQLHFRLDSETSEPLEASVYELREVNSLVEEFMLYANIKVAERIHEVFPQTAMLRRHEPPLASRFENLNRALKRFKVQLDPESNKTLTESLDNVAEKQKSLDEIVRIMTTRCMQFAKYFAAGTQPYENFLHYGLATPIYTHFTSPIRRYADLVVHRQLAIACGAEEETNLLASKQLVNDIADNLNFRHRMAQAAGRASSELYLMEHLRKFPGRIEEGKIIRIKPAVFVVILEKYGVEGHIHVDAVEWAFDSAEETLSNGTRTLKIFDTVKVSVNVTEMNMHGRSRLDLQLVDE